MKFIKCPRCELNYIAETEKICSVCKRDVRGEPEQDDIFEMCSECGEHPAMPGQEMCLYCFKEMQRRSAETTGDDASQIQHEEPNLDIDPVSTMDEITIDLPDSVDSPFDDGDESFDDEDEDDDLSDEDDLDDDDFED